MQETLSINEGILHKQVEHTPSEEIFLNDVRFRGSPTIDFALVLVTTSYMHTWPKRQANCNDHTRIHIVWKVILNRSWIVNYDLLFPFDFVCNFRQKRKSLQRKPLILAALLRSLPQLCNVPSALFQLSFFSLFPFFSPNFCSLLFYLRVGPELPKAQNWHLLCPILTSVQLYLWIVVDNHSCWIG